MEKDVGLTGDLASAPAYTRFHPERVATYEAGSRIQATAALSLSVSASYNVYDDLRTIELASSNAFVPLCWGNLTAMGLR